VDTDQILGSECVQIAANASQLPEQLDAQVLFRILSEVVTQVMNETALIWLLITRTGAVGQNQTGDGTMQINGGDSQTVWQTRILLFNLRG
jgi:hypothetical protein